MVPPYVVRSIGQLLHGIASKGQASSPILRLSRRYASGHVHCTHMRSSGASDLLSPERGARSPCTSKPLLAAISRRSTQYPRTMSHWHPFAPQLEQDTLVSKDIRAVEKLAGKYLNVPPGDSPPPLSSFSVDRRFQVLGTLIYQMAVRSYKAEEARQRSEEAHEQTRRGEFRSFQLVDGVTRNFKIGSLAHVSLQYVVKWIGQLLHWTKSKGQGPLRSCAYRAIMHRRLTRTHRRDLSCLM